MKDLMLYKTGSNLPLYNQKEKEEMEKLFDLCSKERLLKLIYSLSELDNQMKWSSQKNIVLQVGIMKACSQEENQGIEELEKRISKLEHALANGTVITQSTEIIPETQIKKEEKKTSEQIEEKQPKETKKQPQETENQLSDSWKGEKVSYWQEIIEELKKNGKIMLYSNLMDTKAIKLNDLIIGIQFPKGITSFGKAVLEKPENKQALMQIVSLKEGKEMQIRYLEPEKKQNGIKQEQNPLENLGKELDIPINIIEE